jgi:hypothetical protein
MPGWARVSFVELAGELLEEVLDGVDARRDAVFVEHHGELTAGGPHRLG